MTPLAKQIVRELTVKKDRRRIVDQCGLLSMMSDIHCFDCTEVFNAACDLSRDMAAKNSVGAVRGRLGFLPALKTWIEYESEDIRLGMLLIDSGDTAKVFLALDAHKAVGIRGVITYPGFGVVPLRDAPKLDSAGIYDCSDVSDAMMPGVRQAMSAVLPFLAMINTPRIIGRTQHMPNAALERRLASAMGVGKFPLHGWTEIRLEVAPPKICDDAPVEAHLTGERALHFCRQHLRVRFGRLELVKAHWRGDAFLGIKQSRYRLVEG